MFRLAACVIQDRRVLLVEDDEHTAGMISQVVACNGGEVVCVLPTVESALAMAPGLTPDIVMLHIRYVPSSNITIADLFRPLGIETQFLACFDDWFEFAEEPSDGDRLVAVC